MWPLSSGQCNVSKGDGHYAQDWPIKPSHRFSMLSFHPQCQWGRLQGPRTSPNPKSLSPSWRGTATVRETVTRRTASQGDRLREQCLQYNVSLFAGNLNPWLSTAAKQMLTISGQHKTQLWTILSPFGLAETSSELHHCPSLFLLTSPSFPLSFHRWQTCPHSEDLPCLPLLSPLFLSWALLPIHV